MLVKKIFWSAIEIISTRLIQLAITVILARLLTPEDFGLIALVMVFVSLSQVVVDGGLSASIIRKNELSETQISTAFYMNAILAFSIYILIYLSAPKLAEIVGDDRLDSVLRVVGLVLVINIANFVPRALFTRAMEYKALGISSILGATLSGFISVFLALNGYGYWALVAQTLVMNLVCALILNLYCGRNKYRQFDVAVAKGLLSYGYKILLSGLVDILFKNVYVVLISKNYTSREVGLFSQSERLASLPIISFTQILQRVNFQVMVKANKNREKLSDIYLIVFKSFSLIFTPFCIYLAFYSSQIVVITLGKQWSDMSALFSVMIISYLCIPLGSVSLNIIKAIGDSALYLKLELVKKGIILGTALVAVNIGFNALVYSIILASLINLVIDVSGVKKHIFVPTIGIFAYQFMTLFFSITSIFAVEAIYTDANYSILGFLIALSTHILLYMLQIFIFDRKTVVKIFNFYI